MKMIVVNMDMPKTCGTCKLSVGYTCTKWLKLYPDEMASEKAEDCPIVAEIPQKHGRLIDADAVMDNGINKGFCDWYDEIKYAPTIIEADRGEEE